MEPERKRIAVIYATAQGSTRDIAEFIGTELTARGAEVEVADTAHAPELSRFDAVVIGSAIHNRDFLPDAVAYIHEHRRQLAQLDVWMFSVGLGPALVGPIGRRIGRVVPTKIAALRDSIHPREYQPFAGHYERAGVDLFARALYRTMGGTRYGDLRDWPAIREWASDIAAEMHLPAPKSSTIQP